MSNGWNWSHSAGPVALLTANGAYKRDSRQHVYYHIRLCDKKPSEIPVAADTASAKTGSSPDPTFGRRNRIQLKQLLYLCRRSAFRCRVSVSRSTNRLELKWSAILCLPCVSCVRRSVRCGEILPGHGVILMIFLSSSFLRIAVFERFYIINDEDNIFHLNPQIRAISSSSSGHNGFSSVDKLPVSIAFRIISIEGTA